MKRCSGRWIEWLAVAGCVGFGLAVLFPAAGLARGWGKMEMCMANVHILGRGWLAYAEDYDGRLVGGSNYTDTPYRWVERPLYSPTYSSPPVSSGNEYTLEYRLNGIRAGKLYPYIQDTQVYHCPADRAWVDGTAPLQPYRSYSIGGLMNGEDYTSRSGNTITGYRTVNFPTGAKKLINAERMSQIRRPADKFVFVEEDVWDRSVFGGQLENLGSFILMYFSNPDSWWDSPALIHPDRGMLGFADGHVAGKVWTDARTIALLQGTIPGTSTDLFQPNNADLQWMIKGYMPAEP